MPLVAKICGMETEYANGQTGLRDPEANFTLVEMLLREGFSNGRSATGRTKRTEHPNSYGSYGYNDGCAYSHYGRPYSGRDFLPNGSRMYNDHAHIEYSTQEVRSAWDLVAAARAGDFLVDQARRKVEGGLPEGARLEILANNADTNEQSYGGHMNVLMDRGAFNGLFERKPHLIYSFLIPYIVSIQTVTGAGKVGKRSGENPLGFELSQRADFIDRADPSLDTTYRRALVNTRDEPLADERRYARLHVITFDTNRHQHAIFLKAGSLQLIVAMLEDAILRGTRHLKRDLTLDDPLCAIRAISRDPELRCAVRLAADRKMWTAVEIQKEILEAVLPFASSETAEELVPGAGRIAEAWAHTIGMLERRDDDALVRRLDWAAKLKLIERHAERVGTDDPSLQEIDLQYANIAKDRGFFHTVFENNGLAETVVSDERIGCFAEYGPEDTRSYCRARLVRRMGEELDFVGWDEACLREGSGWWPRFPRMRMDDPLSLTKAEVDPFFDSNGSERQLFNALREITGGDDRTPSYATPMEMDSLRSLVPGYGPKKEVVQ